MAKIRRSQVFPKPLQVNVYNRQKALTLDKRLVQKMVASILSFLEVEAEEVSVYFVSEKKITSLHGEFFQDPTPTDCISFPIDESLLGEIFVCPSVAINYAKKHRLDPFEETILYVIHGLLHLLGYDDLDPKSKSIMRRMEKKCMNHLRSNY